MVTMHPRYHRYVYCRLSLFFPPAGGMGLAIVESCLLGEDMDGRVDEEGAGDYVLGT